MIAFGPVPSRRLGRSLGINHIPPKVCTCSCAYCQLGRTIRVQVERQAFYEPMDILHEVRSKVEMVRERGEAVDYVTFVPDGEPTLDAELGREIRLVERLGIPVAVITNSSLIWQPQVREDLVEADWVSLKVDAVEEPAWRRVDRPHRSLRLASILDGALAFARSFQGKLVTETMLVAGVNDGEEHLAEVADFLARLQPAVAYLAVPTRPPAEGWVRPPDEGTLNRAYQILSAQVGRVEYLIGYEGNAFACTGDAEDDLLSITAVHPMREAAVGTFLARAGTDWSMVHGLLAQGQLIETEYQGRRFYMRRIGHAHRSFSRGK
jgi:wyosine [tRNA(Phe)-imidazoG37] synthetase (radical SAM superfamily)